MLDSTDFQILSMETVPRLSDHPRTLAQEAIAKYKAPEIPPVCNQHGSKDGEVSPKLPTDETLKKTFRLTDQELVGHVHRFRRLRWSDIELHCECGATEPTL